MYKKRYLITGGSGFIGTQLIKQLLIEEHEVTVLTRDDVKTLKLFENVMKSSLLPNQTSGKIQTIIDLGELNSSNSSSFDVVINLAGQGIADKRWSDSVKQQLLDSRINTTKALYDYLKDTLVKPDVVISGSALGYYGLHDDDIKIDEHGKTDDSFSSQLCVAWEKEAKHIEDLGIRTCFLRTGIVLGKNGGALSKMLPPFKFGLGGPMGSGKQWMSWIHMDDLIGIIRYVVKTESVTGAINATAPNPVTNKTFSSTLGQVLKRPAFIPMPAFVMKLMLGEMAEELLLSGQRVVPDKIVKAGYQFQYPELKSAIKNLI
ncbi:MAG: TIGR01777 family oxidoreductase [Cocleimonas sp.]|nr:TIGR01777 family oxidoreductase [Cocleimonas sp.]